MSDVPGRELKFENRAELEAWLGRFQSQKVSLVIAARAALRILPSLDRWQEPGKAQEFLELAFASFWATAVAWVAAKYPARAVELPTSAATSAAYASVPATSKSCPSLVAGHAALTASSATNAAWAAGNAVYAAASAAAATTDIWEAVSADATRLKIVSPSDLASEPLWPLGVPQWVLSDFSELLGALSAPHWKPWLDWFERRRNGYEDREDIELLFATLPVDPRKKDPAEQNAALAVAIERLRTSKLSEVPRGELKFENADDLESWLRGQRREVSIVIGARAAARGLPALYRSTEWLRERDFSQLVFASFWATALARVAAKHPARANDLLVAADFAASAAHATADSAANAAAAAADTVGTTDAELAASSAASAADSSANAVAGAPSASGDATEAAASDFWAAVSADANRLRTVSPSDIASEPLWPGERTPKWVAPNWRSLENALGPRWKPWLDWYGRRLDGIESSEEKELLFATLPVDPRKSDPAEQNAALAAEIERLRKSDPEPIDPAIAGAVARVVHDPHGANVAIVEGQARIVGAASEGDIAAAQDPQTRQLHERTKVRAAAALSQAKRLHNQGGFGNIAENLDEFSKWIEGDTESVAQNISTVWELTVAIGTFIDRDDKAGSTPDDMTPKMDLAAREALDQLIVSAAPLVRRFPTAVANDEAYRAFKQPKEPVAPSMRLVLAGAGAQVIERETGQVLKIALEASEREGPQAEKSRSWSVPTVRKVVIAMFVSVLGLGGAFATGVATKAGEKFGEKSHSVERMVNYLLQHEHDIMESFHGLTPDIPAAAREFFRRLRADYPPSPDAGEGP